MNYSAPKLVAITLSKVKWKYITFINNILTSIMTFVSVFKLQILERHNFSHHFTPTIFASSLGFWRLLNQCAPQINQNINKLKTSSAAGDTI